MNVPFSMKMPEKTKARLEALADAARRSMSAQVAHLIDAEFARRTATPQLQAHEREVLQQVAQALREGRPGYHPGAEPTVRPVAAQEV